MSARDPGIRDDPVSTPGLEDLQRLAEFAEGIGRLSRRRALRLLAGVPVASLVISPREVMRAMEARPVAGAPQRTTGPQQPAADRKPTFFTAHEYRTVTLLADMILPADERSGSASDAGVPAFLDFIVTEYPSRQLAMRGGLAWLDAESLHRFDARFVDATDEQRGAILDDVAWPERTPPELSHGAAFFNAFRDLVASGFFSSRMGIEDLAYRGNRYVMNWRGCPEEQLRRLGVED